MNSKSAIETKIREMKSRAWLTAHAITNLHSSIVKLGKKIIICILYIKTDRQTLESPNSSYNIDGVFQIVLMTSYLTTTTLPTCVLGTLLGLGFALCAQHNTVHPVQYKENIFSVWLKYKQFTRCNYVSAMLWNSTPILCNIYSYFVYKICFMFDNHLS